MLRTRLRLAIVMALACACGSSNTPTPSPPGGQVGESITGRERIGWDQVAGSTAELASLRYAIYVDGNRSQLTEVSCAQTAGPAGFPCSARLPTMSTGSHTLEIVAFTDSAGLVESSRSAPLRVTVTGTTSPVEHSPVAHGDRIRTSDDVELVVEKLATDLPQVTDIAFVPDGRILLTAAAGTLTLLDSSGTQHPLLDLPATRAAGGLLSITLSPDFQTSGHLLLAAGFATDQGNVVRVLRYRFRDGAAIEGVVLLPEVKGALHPSASMRIGPDGKLYAAFGAIDDEGALRLSEWSGKILRLESDGRTPDDQPAASPVMWSGIRVPRGLGWGADGHLWAAEEGIDGVERLRGLMLRSEGNVRRADPRASYALPKGFGGRSLAVYASDAISAFADNLFLAGDSDFLLRISFDVDARSRARSSERLLEGRVTTIRAVAAGRDGALYFCTEDTLWRLTASGPLRRRE